MGMSKFEITANIIGEGSKVLVDGEEQKGLMGLELHVGVNEPTQLVLYRFGEGTVSGEGIVTTVTPQEFAPKVIAWIESLNPKRLEERALEMMEWGDGNQSITQFILMAMVEEVQNAHRSQRPDSGS